MQDAFFSILHGGSEVPADRQRQRGVVVSRREEVDLAADDGNFRGVSDRPTRR
jgi:hypothetical protein